MVIWLALPKLSPHTAPLSPELIGSNKARYYPKFFNRKM